MSGYVERFLYIPRAKVKEVELVEAMILNADTEPVSSSAFTDEQLCTSVALEFLSRTWQSYRRWKLDRQGTSRRRNVTLSRERREPLRDETRLCARCKALGSPAPMPMRGGNPGESRKQIGQRHESLLHCFTASLLLAQHETVKHEAQGEALQTRRSSTCCRRRGLRWIEMD